MHVDGSDDLSRALHQQLVWVEGSHLHANLSVLESVFWGSAKFDTVPSAKFPVDGAPSRILVTSLC